MAKSIDAATRIQIATLRAAGNTHFQIADQLGIHRQTVATALRKIADETKAKILRDIATRDDILKHMTHIMQNTERAADSIAAAKLIATMQGWITPVNEPAVNINLIGNNDVKALEAEYARIREALESPTTHDAAQGEGMVSIEAQSSILGQPGANPALPEPARDSEGVGSPPARGDENE